MPRHSGSHRRPPGQRRLRLWIGCRQCWAAGSPVGAWFDATAAPTDVAYFNNDRRVKPPPDHYTDDHRTLWVFDHRGFGTDLAGGEMPPAEARAVARRLLGLIEE